MPHCVLSHLYFVVIASLFILVLFDLVIFDVVQPLELLEFLWLIQILIASTFVAKFYLWFENFNFIYCRYLLPLLLIDIYVHYLSHYQWFFAIIIDYHLLWFIWRTYEKLRNCNDGSQYFSWVWVTIPSASEMNIWVKGNIGKSGSASSKSYQLEIVCTKQK